LAAQGRLSGFVCRCQFGQVRGEVEYDVDRLRILVSIVIAIHIIHLSAIAHDPLPSVLEKYLHVGAGRCEYHPNSSPS
jgi:hypothetical protein